MIARGAFQTRERSKAISFNYFGAVVNFNCCAGICMQIRQSTVLEFVLGYMVRTQVMERESPFPPKPLKPALTTWP